MRKTWAPGGQTPILHHRYRHDRISVISGISISPRCRRIGLYFQCHTKNIQHGEVCEFLRYLLCHLRGYVIVIWDNASIHKGERIREICRRFPRLHLELLPSYAPQLNPDEAVWAYLKKWQGLPAEQLGSAVSGDEDGAVVSWWLVESRGKGGEHAAFFQALAVNQEGKRVPPLERKGTSLFDRNAAEPSLTVADREQVLHDFIEPMVQRELHHKGLVPEGGGYSAKLVGWLEVVGNG